MTRHMRAGAARLSPPRGHEPGSSCRRIRPSAPTASRSSARPLCPHFRWSWQTGCSPPPRCSCGPGGPRGRRRAAGSARDHRPACPHAGRCPQERRRPDGAPPCFGPALRRGRAAGVRSRPAPVRGAARRATRARATRGVAARRSRCNDWWRCGRTWPRRGDVPHQWTRPSPRRARSSRRSIRPTVRELGFEASLRAAVAPFPVRAIDRAHHPQRRRRPCARRLGAAPGRAGAGRQRRQARVPTTIDVRRHGGRRNDRRRGQRRRRRY